MIHLSLTVTLDSFLLLSMPLLVLVPVSMTMTMIVVVSQALQRRQSIHARHIFHIVTSTSHVMLKRLSVVSHPKLHTLSLVIGFSAPTSRQVRRHVDHPWISSQTIWHIHCRTARTTGIAGPTQSILRPRVLRYLR